MTRNRMLLLVVAELVLAVVFAATSFFVLMYRNDDVRLLAVLAVIGIAGLLNGLYLLRQRGKPPGRRRSGKARR